MEKILKIIKINALALFALPLLLLATTAKILSKTLEKLLVMVGMVLGVFALAAIFELLKNPMESLNAIIIFLVFMVFFGIVIYLMIMIIGLLSNIGVMVVALLITITDWLYSVIYSGYAALYHICKSDFEELHQEEQGAALYVKCFLYTVTSGVNRGIIFFMVQAFKLSVAGSAAFLIWAVYTAYVRVNTTFGIGLIAYLQLFSLYEMIFGVAMFLAVVTCGIVILLSVGIEWNEWGQEMDFTTSRYEEYLDSIESREDAIRSQHIIDDKGTEQEQFGKCNEAMEHFLRQVREFSLFSDTVNSTLEQSDDMLLRTNFGEYVRLLKELSDIIANYNGNIPVETFTRYIPKITKLEQLKLKIEAQVEHLKSETKQHNSSSMFFSGCDTLEKLNRRYKALCKTYHPDGEFGDEETFKKMKDEYDGLIAKAQG